MSKKNKESEVNADNISLSYAKLPFRVAIVASYDSKGCVQPYLLTYLRRLREICAKIILVADNETSAQEQQKSEPFVDYQIFQRHGEYDFGSYKRGWIYLSAQSWFDQVDEIILCNDSCFSVGSFEPAFRQFSKNPCDFWGMTSSTGCQLHLQSFFLVFRQKAFHTIEFDRFLRAVTHQSGHDAIVRAYEFPFRKCLEDVGLKADALINGVKSPHQRPITTFKRGMPLIKKKNFIVPHGNLEAVSLQSIGRLLFILKHRSPNDYHEILDYLDASPVALSFRYFLAYHWFRLRRFFYYKKRFSDGRVRLKICGISVPHCLLRS